MADLKLHHPTQKLRGSVKIPGSKSESHRALLVQALYAPQARLSGLSTSNDTQVLQRALECYQVKSEIQVEDAGTPARFLCAFLATQKGTWTLDGSPRMRERPMAPLLQALRNLGAQIESLGQEDCLPLRIRGAHLEGGELAIEAGTSSQFISALMLIGASMPMGLSLKLVGQVVSLPYIYLTANVMRKMGLKVVVLGDEIRVPYQNRPRIEHFAVEPDWSSASYFWSMVALAKEAELFLPGFREFSMQGDSLITQYMAPLGVESIFIGAGYRIRKGGTSPIPLELNMKDQPDLVQTLAVAYGALAKDIRFKGLQTLRLKETDRIKALAKELAKFRSEVREEASALAISGALSWSNQPSFETYDDHRMAMSLAPLALVKPVIIKEAEVVKKSFPEYWETLRELGFEMERL